VNGERAAANDLDTIRVRDVMAHDIVTVSAAAPVADLVKLLDFEQIGGAPVVDPAGRLLGVASATDVIREVAQASGTAVEPGSGLVVRDIMTPATFTVRPDTTLREAARFLVRGGIHRALVLDDKRLVGIVSAFDIVRALAMDAGHPEGTA
jgi:CBS domain-containing protein